MLLRWSKQLFLYISFMGLKAVSGIPDHGAENIGGNFGFLSSRRCPFLRVLE
jgi:hypothetical protein